MWIACPKSSTDCVEPANILASQEFSICMNRKVPNDIKSKKKRRLTQSRASLYRNYDITNHQQSAQQATTEYNSPLKRYKNHGNIGAKKNKFIKETQPQNIDSPRTKKNQINVDFEILLRNEAGISAFRHFLNTEYSADNLDFWVDCQQYIVADEKELRSKSEEIFLKYLTPRSPHEVNLNYSLKRSAQLRAHQGDRRAFLRPQRAIYRLMSEDSFPRFNRKFPNLVPHLRSLHKLTWV